MPETERIAAALEPELRRVIDMTMDRVAKIERETMRGTRELMTSAGENSKEALDRSSRLVDSLDALTGTVNKVTSALRTEVDDVTQSLRGLHGLNVELPEEMTGNASHSEAQQAEPQPPPDPEPPLAPDPPASEAPAPEALAPELGAPDPEIDPSPELTGMFREQITRMRDEGRSRDEAERVLLRFRLGHRFLGMLDEIYLSGGPSTRGRRKRGPFARFRRHD